MVNLPVNIVEALPRASPWSLSLREPPPPTPDVLPQSPGLPVAGGGGWVSWLSPTPFLSLLLWASCSLHLFLKLYNFSSSPSPLCSKVLVLGEGA